jgi:hypothetical protein
MTAQTNFCGNFTKPVTVSAAIGNSNTPYKFSDCFGNLYTPDELRIYKNPNILSLRNTYEEGIFILTFQDEEKDNNIGFDHPTLGEDRRAVVRQIFSEMSAFLITPSNTARVRINIEESGILPTAGSGTTRVLGEGKPIYTYLGANNLLDCEVSKTINGGVDSYLYLDPSIRPLNAAHGLIKFNFPIGADTEFHYDISVAVPQTSTRFDFYTVALHEIIHCMGFGMGMTSGGFGILEGNFMRYDSNLRFFDATTFPFLLSFNSPTGNQVTYSTNRGANALFKGCGPNNGIRFAGQNVANQEVHTPTTWSQGSSLSHFECEPNCNNPAQNVMRSCATPGTNGMFRHPSQAEANAFCDLGYRRNITWGLVPSNTTIFKTYTGCSVNQCAYGVNDRFDDGGMPFEIIGNGNITISNALKNDIGTGLTITDLQIRSVYGRDSNGNPVTIGEISEQTPNSFKFTASSQFIGVAVLSYVPMCASNNSIRGNVTYICIRVRPAPCPAITVPTCGQDLVCWGNFESTFTHHLYSDFRPGINSSNSTDIYERNSIGAFFTYFNPFNVSHNSLCGPFPYPLPNGNNNNRYLGIGGHPTNKEAAALPLRALLDPSKTYRLTFDATARSWFSPDCNATSVLRILGADQAPCAPPEKTSMTPGTVLGCGFNPININANEGKVILNSSTNWTTYQVEFSGKAINHLLFTVESSTYIFIDNVKLELITCPVPCQPAGYTAVGTSATAVTNVSTLVAAGILPNTYTQTGTPREQLYIQGTLVVDRDYGFYDSHLKMALGSRIVVNTGKLLDISQGTLIEGCDQMWKGIEFQGGAFIYVTNSTIKDAEYAVRILRNNAGVTTIALNGSNFSDNYYNLYVEPTANVASHISQFSHAVMCMFGNPRGSLKPAYSGQTKYDIKTFSGISVNDVASMGIYDCSFMSMDYGLLALGSNFLLQRNKFSNMPRRVVANADDLGGFAISITGGSLFCYGSGANGAAAFDNVDLGIRVISGRFGIEDCNITNCNYGIRVNNAAYSQNSTIKNNKFRVKQEAVRISQSGTARMYIQNNDIAPNLDEEIKGIVIHENGYYNPEFDIRDNIIKVISRSINIGLGIQIYGQNSAGFTIVSKNRVYLDNRTPQYIALGITASYSGNLTIDNNYIEGIGQMFGYGMWLADCVGWYGASTLSCNGIDNLDNGMLFSGNNMLDQGLKFNRFLRIKKTGLQIYGSGSIIGQQLNTGNQWEFGGYTDFAAINSSGNFVASRITTDPSPLYFARNNISPSTGWFVPQSGNIPTAACTINLNTPVLQVRGAELTEEEIVNNPNSSYRTVAEGKNINQTEAIQNIANRQLMRFIEEKSKTNRFTLNNSFNDFNTKVKNKLERKQYDWDKDFNAAVTMDNALLNRFKENARLQEEAIKKAAATTQRIADLELRDKAEAAKLAVTDNTLTNLMKERKDMETEHSKKLERAKAKLRTDNKNNRGQKLYETHESYVNDAFLDLTEGKKIDKTQIDQLDAIANLCPSVGGVAVYKARSVLGSLTDQIGTRSWNDMKNCDISIPNLRSTVEVSNKSEITIPKVLAYPNPTNDMLKLSFYDTNNIDDTPYSIQIFNLTGSIVKHIELEKLQDTNIDTKGLSSGVYFLKITALEGTWSQTLKISILR